MEFRILGPMEVLADGCAVPLGGGRERTLLALLLLSANRVVSSDELIDGLWGDHPPEEAAHALGVLVSRLRKALREGGGGDGIVVTRPPGYMARVESGVLDAARFVSLVARAREAAAGGDYPAAGDDLRAALTLWRGPVLADLGDTPLARVESARLEEARLAALEERIDADLACGRHRELVGELEASTRVHPLRERLWWQRMLALYRAGRQADALRVYQEVRRVLGEELGVEPGEALLRLESAILRHDPDLEGAPVPPPVAVHHGRPAAAPSTPTETSRGAGGLVTILFTDLVGSTELVARAGDEKAQGIFRAHHRLLTQAVAARGGHEVKWLGDGLMVAFPSAADAVRTAIAMQQASSRPVDGQRLAIRIGLNAGEALREEADYFGIPVIVARRVCDQAGAGQILCTQVVRDLLAGRLEFSLAEVGKFPLKGLPEPVAVCEVAWEPPRSSVPVPSLLTEIDRAFVGRARELAWLEQLWKEAVAGDARLALLSGEPGVGKTRLAAELADRAHAQGATVLAGRCDEDLGVPYQPFVEALRHFVEHTLTADLGRSLGRHGAELVRLVPEIASRLPDLPPQLYSDPETERYRLFDAVAAWLAAASADAPLLLVLDDLQWAAKPTLLLLRHAVRSPEVERVLLVGTYRDTELSHDHPLLELLADLRRERGVERFSLMGLDASGVAAYLEMVAGHDLDDDDRLLSRAIYEETEGNPFFVREVLHHLTETGAIERREGRWTTRLPVEELGIPEGVREVVGRRLSRLTEAATRVLRVAAVLGAEFELPVLQTAANLDEEALISVLEEATGARLVIEAPGPRYRFTHALVRDTLYADLTAARRVALHRRVAEAIEAVHGARLDDYLPALAHHFSRAAAPAADATRAIAYAKRAGDRALAQLAHDEAAGYYRQALELLEIHEGAADEGHRVELLIALGEAQLCAGDAAHRNTLLEAGRLAQEIGDAERAARAALANQRGLFTGFATIDANRVAALEAAIEAVGPGVTVLRARLLAALATELQFAGERRLTVGREALAIARQVGDPATLAEVLAAVWLASWGLGPLPERFEMAGELSELSRQLSDRRLEFRAGVVMFITASERGDVDRVESALRSCSQLAEELSQPMLLWRVTHLRMHWAMSKGRFDEFERAAEESFRLGEGAGQPDALLFSSGPVGIVRLLQGRPEEAFELVSSLLEQFPAAAIYQAVRGWALAGMGRLEEAGDFLTGFRAEGFARLPLDYSRLFTLIMLARTCSLLNDRAAAGELHALLLPHREAMTVGQAAWMGPVSHDLGVLAATLGRHDEAEGHFADAVEVQERIGALGTLVHTRLEWARMLLTRRQPGDVERARELLGRALATASDLHLPEVEERAMELLC